MSKTIRSGVALLLGLMVAGVAQAAMAQDQHGSAMPHETSPQGGARASSFYPNEVKGGVSGNLPFNNQIRKHTDPLNANGAGR